VGWITPAAIVVAIIVWIAASRSAKRRARLRYLRDKYQDEVVVQRILGGQIWHSQSIEQLKDSIGEPLAVDQKTLKTKTREIWKYEHRGANRYGLRITVENGCVAGWDQKS
jgi:hypothetical protein